MELVNHKKKKIVCVNCPLGCKINVIYADADEVEIFEAKGNRCKRGLEYVKQELTDPLRVVVTSVKVENGEMPLASVRSTKPIPLRLMNDIMEILKNTKITAPVKRGDVIMKNILGTGSDIIITRSVNKID